MLEFCSLLLDAPCWFYLSFGSVAIKEILGVGSISLWFLGRRDLSLGFGTCLGYSNLRDHRRRHFLYMGMERCYAADSAKWVYQSLLFHFHGIDICRSVSLPKSNRCWRLRRDVLEVSCVVVMHRQLSYIIIYSLKRIHLQHLVVLLASVLPSRLGLPSVSLRVSPLSAPSKPNNM